MKLRVVTWNVGCGPTASHYRKSHDEAWDYLLHELRPNVALVQEALVEKIKEARRSHTVILCDMDSGVTAGTAVLIHGLDVNMVPSVAVSSHTYSAAAEIRTPAGPLIVIGVHVYPGDEQAADLKRLAELFSTAFVNSAILVGGDFNAARHFDKVYGRNKYRPFFAAMETAGLRDVHWDIFGREIQSFWGRQTKEPYQDDHLFITKTWSKRVLSCSVIDNEFVRRVSDHGPLLLELDANAT